MNLSNLIFLVCFMVSIAHGSGWCNEPSFQKYAINSPLLFSCDDSQLKDEIAELKEKVEANRQILSRLEETCNISAIIELLQAVLPMNTDAPSITTEAVTSTSETLIDTTQEPTSEEPTSEEPTGPVGSFSNPAFNCSEIESLSGTGTYSLRADNGNVVNVTCDFDVQLPPLTPFSGWQEIVNSDFSQHSQSCPQPFRETLFGLSRRCGRSTTDAGCQSTSFPTGSIPFTKLCGRVVGYGSGRPDGFCTNCGIDGPYVDGVSITYGSTGSRQHIWTLAAVFLLNNSCPCSNGGIANSSPLFVGEDYYCESSTELSSTGMLWEGEGCADADSNEAPCCDNPNLPWFCREFDEPILTDNIEVRICTIEDAASGDIELELLKLFVR